MRLGPNEEIYGAGLTDRIIGHHSTTSGRTEEDTIFGMKRFGRRNVFWARSAVILRYDRPMLSWSVVTEMASTLTLLLLLSPLLGFARTRLATEHSVSIIDSNPPLLFPNFLSISS